MNEVKKETRSGVAAPERASENVLSSRQNTFSDKDNTTETKFRQIGWIYKNLPMGKENAITGRELAKRLGIQDLRHLTAQIERERRIGLPVCAAVGTGEAGYYKPDSPDELELYLLSLNRRIRNLRRTAERLCDTLAEWRGQERIWMDSDD